MDDTDLKCKSCGKPIEEGLLCDDCIKNNKEDESIEEQISTLNQLYNEESTNNKGKVYSMDEVKEEKPQPKIEEFYKKEESIGTVPIIIFSLLAVFFPPASLIAGIYYVIKEEETKKVFGTTMIIVSLLTTIIFSFLCCSFAGVIGVMMDSGYY